MADPDYPDNVSELPFQPDGDIARIKMQPHSVEAEQSVLGGLLLGLLESFGTQIPFIGTEWKDVFSFGILILLLVFKPTGILGKTEIERM